jgi:hypothetical protein
MAQEQSPIQTAHCGKQQPETEVQKICSLLYAASQPVDDSVSENSSCRITASAHHPL